MFPLNTLHKLDTIYKSLHPHNKNPTITDILHWLQQHPTLGYTTNPNLLHRYYLQALTTYETQNIG